MSYTDYNQVLQDLADTIRDSNGSTASIQFVDMPDLIESFISPRIIARNYSSLSWKLYLVPYIGNTSDMSDMHNMFQGTDFNSILDLSNFDTSNVINMSYMFDSCKVSSVDVSSFDTSNVTNMSYMFRSFMYRDTNAILDLSNFDTSNVTNMYGMFNNFGVYSTTSARFSVTLNVTGWDVSNVTKFDECFSLTSSTPQSSITELDLSGWDTSSATGMQNMFKQCKLQKMWIPSTFVATQCPSDRKPFSQASSVTCHIYTDASSASEQDWGSINSSFVVHYNSTHEDYENA